MSNHLIEIFETEEEVMRKIEQLINDGYSEADMYIMARTDGQISMVKRKTNVDTHVSEGNWMDRFTTFLTGDEKVQQAFRSMGIDEQDSEEYYHKVQNGQLLLYVNKNYGENLETESEDSFRLGEKEKTERQNKKLESENQPEPRAESEEEAVGLDERQYEDPASKPDEKNFI